MHRDPSRTLLAAFILAAPASFALAEPIVDAANDLINGFNAATAPDLDVRTAEATYDFLTNTFTFTATMGGTLGTTATASYVWGVNRGAGTAGFAANGYTNVLFDRVVRLVPGGTSQIAGGGLPAIDIAPSAVTFSGATITAIIPANLLPSTGASFDAYTVNLWPRVNAPAGFAGISDFAPDSANAKVSVVPAPTAAAALGIAGLLGSRRRRA